MHHLLFVEQAYAFSILRPFADAARARGDRVTWYVLGNLTSDLLMGDDVLRRLHDARQVQSDTVIVPGNWIPGGLNGLVVQVFHGFGIEKKGHFRIRGFFDLYCTPGPVPTNWFTQKADQHGYFRVIETGWPKLDPIAAAASTEHRPGSPLRVLFAPTFSETLTSAPDLLPVFDTLLENPHYAITVRFHPLMDGETVAKYRALVPKGLIIDDSDSAMDTIAANDIVVSDTSSIVHEALWHHRPVITLRNLSPGDHILDLASPDQLAPALKQVETQYDNFVNRGVGFVREIHPYWDGQSSVRVLNAIDATLAHPATGRKPGNRWRKWRIAQKIRRIEKGLAQ